MCGICGSAGLADADLLANMAASIIHRGPDEGGVYIEPGLVGLGIRRLRIIDLAKGGQPMFNEDRSVVVVFNGEIYNYQGLRKNLEERGHQFRTNSDTEVIVHLYEDHDLAFTKSLRGMFAIALWDKRARRLVLVRDRLGIKPLYYWEHSGRLLFASEIKAIIKSPEVGRVVNYRALTNYLTFGFVPAPDTMFAGVQKLHPGYMLIWQDGQITVRPYWQLHFSPQKARPTELIERLDQALQESVRLHLVSDVSVGAFLSGGIDSSLVVALMAKEMDRPVDTFTVGFDTAGSYDETKAARLVAQYLGTNHHEIVVTQPDVDLLSRLAWHMDEPLADMAILPTYLVAEFARRNGIIVALSGEGGDEMFAGYPKYALDSLVSYAYLLPPSVRLMMARLLQTLLPADRYKRAAERLLASSDRIERQLGWMRNNFSSGDLMALCTPHLCQELQSQADQLIRQYFEVGPNSNIAAMQYADARTFLAEDLLMKVDRMTMAVSLEARVPYLDHCVVELAVQMPDHMKISGLKTKLTLRALAKERLPFETFTRKKHTFLVPVAAWLRGPWRTLVEDTLLGHATCQRQWLSSSYIQTLVDQHLSGRADHSSRLWSLMMLELWYREFMNQ